MKGLSFVGFAVPAIGLIIVIIWIGIAIVGKNINAKDLVFSYTALAAAFVMFSLNLGFSLKNEELEYVIQPHLILTSDCVDVYSDLATKSNFVVFNREKLSSSLDLAGVVTKPGAPSFTDAENSVFKRNILEFLRVSVVGHLLTEYPDWSPDVKSFRGKRHIQFNNSEEGAGDNSYYSVEKMAEALQFSAGGFAVAESVGITNGLTLPPNTTMSTNGENIVLENPYSLIEIDFEVEDGMSFAVPSYSGHKLFLDQRNMNQGVVNIQSNIRIKVLHKKQRFGSPQRVKYESWASEIVNVIEIGFSPVPPGNA